MSGRESGRTLNMELDLQTFMRKLGQIIQEGDEKYGETFNATYASHPDLGYTISEKMIRFRAARNMQDIFKVATYCYLIWRHHERYGDPTELQVRNAPTVPLQGIDAPGTSTPHVKDGTSY